MTSDQLNDKKKNMAVWGLGERPHGVTEAVGQNRKRPTIQTMSTNDGNICACGSIYRNANTKKSIFV